MNQYFKKKLFHKGSTSGENALTKTQVETLLTKVTNLRDLALLKLAINGGIRRDDIIGIRRKNIDFNTNEIKYYEHKKKRIYSTYVSNDTLNTLKMWINMSKKSEWLFPSVYKKSKKHISGKTAYNILNRNLEKAGLPQRPFHALRSTCVKLCKSKGWTASQTAKHIGDTVRTVEEHYATPSEEEMKNLSKDNPLI